VAFVILLHLSIFLRELACDWPDARLTPEACASYRRAWGPMMPALIIGASEWRDRFGIKRLSQAPA
jgi:hypothetical protein